MTVGANESPCIRRPANKASRVSPAPTLAERRYIRPIRFSAPATPGWQHRGKKFMARCNAGPVLRFLQEMAISLSYAFPSRP
jgi:hypothetical protein